MKIDTASLKQHATKIFEFIFGAFGFIIGLIGLIGSTGLANEILFLIIIIYSILLFAHGAYLFIVYFHGKYRLEELRNQVVVKTGENKQLLREIALKEEAFRALNSNYTFLQGTLSYLQSVLIDIIDHYARAGDEIDQAAEEMKEHHYDADQIAVKSLEANRRRNEECGKRLIDEYNRFLSNITSRTRDSIEAYLKSKGMVYQVAVTIKQLTNPLPIANIHEYANYDNIYTSFRDSKSYNDPNRNVRIGEPPCGEDGYCLNLHSIKGNTDFSYSIYHDYFIFNNKAVNSHDYCNTSERWFEKYNCGATAAILSRGTDSLVYGFLACDIFNRDLQVSNIIDENVALILRTTSRMITAYYDSTHYNWEFYRIAASRYDSFWDMLYTYHANNKVIF